MVDSCRWLMVVVAKCCIRKGSRQEAVIEGAKGRSSGLQTGKEPVPVCCEWPACTATPHTGADSLLFSLSFQWKTWSFGVEDSALMAVNLGGSGDQTTTGALAPDRALGVQIEKS